MAATRRRPAALAGLAGLVAALVLVSLPLLGRASLIEATSWIDAPLDGAVLPPAPYSVVAHSADQGGVAEVVFEVDGVRLRSLADDGKLRLLTSRFLWAPTGLGTYVLTVRARNADGAWGAPATATVVISGAAPSAAPTVEPGGSPTASSTPGPTLGPGQTAGPTSPPGPTGGPTTPPTATKAPTPAPTPVPTPAPTVCNPPAAIVDNPVDFVQLSFPTEAAPLFEWHYSGGTGCIASQTLHIENQALGVNLDIDLGAGARSYQQRSAFDYDDSDPNDCGHYHWYLITLNVDGDGEQSAPGSFQVCLPNPDG